MPEVPYAEDPRIRRLEELRRGAEETNEREVKSLVAQIQEVRREVEASLSKLSSLSDDLRTRSRRVPNESSNSLVVFANAHLRFAGAASQGMRRTASLDRLLDKAQADKLENERRQLQERQWAASREARKSVERLILPTSDPFDELYGEVVTNAE
jgi:hypothetical protein